MEYIHLILNHKVDIHCSMKLLVDFFVGSEILNGRPDDQSRRM